MNELTQLKRQGKQMTFWRFLLVFWMGGVVAYGLAAFAILRRDGLFKIGTWRNHVIAFITVFTPMVLLWPIVAVYDAVKEER